MRSIILSIVLILLISCHYNESKSLSILIGPKLQDCLFLEKEADDRIIVDVQVISGHRINVRLISPQKESMQFHRQIESLSFHFRTKTAGEYAFCFMNAYSFTEPAAVQFEYDLHETNMNGDSKFKLQLEQEKKDYMKKQMQKHRPRMPDHIQEKAPDVPVVDEEMDNSTISTIKEGLLLLSFHLDRIEHAVKRKTARMSLAHYAQISNKDMVQVFSSVLCILIVIIGCGQVVFLKGFINGKRSWKFWQF